MSFLSCLEEWLLSCAPIFHCRLADHNRVPVRQQFAQRRLLGCGRNIRKFAAAQRRAPRAWATSRSCSTFGLASFMNSGTLSGLCSRSQRSLCKASTAGRKCRPPLADQERFRRRAQCSRAADTCSSSFQAGRGCLGKAILSIQFNVCSVGEDDRFAGVQFCGAVGITPENIETCDRVETSQGRLPVLGADGLGKLPKTVSRTTVSTSNKNLSAGLPRRCRTPRGRIW